MLKVMVMTIPEAFTLGKARHQAGRLEEAQAIFRQILAVAPQHADSLHMLGVISQQAGHSSDSVRLVRRAVELAPSKPEFHSTLSVVLLAQANKDFESDRLEAALAAYNELAGMNLPIALEAMWRRSFILCRFGRFSEAIHDLRRVEAAGAHVPAVHEMLGRALLGAGSKEEGIAYLWRAIELQPSRHWIHSILSDALLPGDGYRQWLRRFHEWLRPPVYLEIGLDTSLELALPPTRAIGIDPQPKGPETYEADTQIFVMTSDEFFATKRLVDVVGCEHIDLAFIDGLHHYDQVLRDFIHVEERSHSGTVVLIHDCLPLDDITSGRELKTPFWTGDCWKIIPILKSARPDLAISTIATAPSGLTVVTRLDAASSILSERFEELVRAQKDTTWTSIEDREAVLSVVANDWEAVRARVAATIEKSICSR